MNCTVNNWYISRISEVTPHTRGLGSREETLRTQREWGNHSVPDHMPILPSSPNSWRFCHLTMVPQVCVFVLPACILHTMCMPGAHAEDEPPCGCWELNLGTLQEQQMLLTAELTLQPLPCSSVFGERKSQLETLHVLTYFWLVSLPSPCYPGTCDPLASWVSRRLCACDTMPK